VETESAPAKLQIGGDVRLLLDAHSRARVDVTRLVLERGRAQLDSGKDYRIEARSIRVSLGKSARAIVSIDAAGVVEVAALSGMVHVENAEGVAVANVAAGRAVELRLGQTSDAAMLTGCIVKNSTAYTLRDEASAVTVELRGADVANDVGRRVQVSGAIVPSQHALAVADQVVQAKAIQVLGAGCGAVESAAVTGSRARSATQPDSASAASSADTADPGSASAGAGGGASGTASTAVTAASTVGVAAGGIGVSTAVIAGVAVAAAAGGTAAAIVATQSHKAPISPGR